MRIAELLSQRDWNHKYCKIMIKDFKTGHTYYRGPVKHLTDSQLQTRIANFEIYHDGHCLTVYVDAYPKEGYAQ